MTGPELRRIFQVGVGEEVPEYEVVNIHHRRHRRSADSQAVHQVIDQIVRKLHLQLLLFLAPCGKI